MRKRILIIVAAVVVVLTAAGTVAAQSTQRFPDVPLEHEAYEAIEWAADVELTLGYDDGTFKPEQPLSRRHAVVFMERFYDDILGADGDDDFTSDSFTRADMMVLLKTINDGRVAKPQDDEQARLSVGECSQRDTLVAAAYADYLDASDALNAAWRGGNVSRIVDAYDDALQAWTTLDSVFGEILTGCRGVLPADNLDANEVRIGDLRTEWESFQAACRRRAAMGWPFDCDGTSGYQSS